MTRNLIRVFLALSFTILTSMASAVETLYIDQPNSYITIAPEIRLTDLDIAFPMKPQQEAGFGSGWYSTGFGTYLNGTIEASIDTAGGTISFPGASYVVAQDSGYWLPYYNAWYPYESAPGNFGGVIDAADAGIGLEGQAVASIRSFAVDVSSTSAIALSGSDGNYVFDSSVDFTNTSGVVDYYGLTGVMTTLGSGRVYSDVTTVANTASAGSVNVHPSGFVEVTIPVQAAFLLNVGDLDIVGQTDAYIPISGQVKAYGLKPGTHENITDLGTLGDSSGTSVARAINESGQVVGWSYDPNGNQRAFLWENGTMQNLGAGTYLGSGTSDAWGINEAGVAAGSNVAGGDHAVTFSNGAIQNLGSLTGPFGPAMAQDINDLGQAVGFSQNAQGIRRAVLYENGQTTDLGASEAWAINNSGQAVGSNDTNGISRAVMFENGNVIPLGSLEGPFGSGAAHDINELGQIVGWSSNALGQTHATLWVNGQAFDLVGLGFDGSGMAHAINDSGWVVGSSAGVATLWRDGVAIDLNTLLPEDSGWNLVEALDINNKNQIVGWGYRYAPSGAYLGQHAFLLQVPEPSSIALLAMGGVGAMLVARRRRIA